METVPDYPDDDDGGMSECERYEWEFNYAALLLADDPFYPLWIEYTNERIH